MEPAGAPVTATELARRVGVSSAAVRALISSGTLPADKVRRGGRDVWVIDAQVAERYVSDHRKVRGAGGGESGAGEAAAGHLQPQRQAADRLAAQVAALQLQLDQLMRAHRALGESHLALLEALRAGEQARQATGTAGQAGSVDPEVLAASAAPLRSMPTDEDPPARRPHQ